jgi:hypothetical protein
MKFVSDYFNAEKFESIFFISAGIIATLIGLYFWFWIKESYFKGMAIALFFIALIQLVVGGTVYVRSPKDIIRVNEMIQNTPEKIQTEEIPRMVSVMKNFQLYRYIEIALICVGVFLFIYFSKHLFWKGLGLGLAIQSALMLVLDFFAEKRGFEYIKQITNLKF